MSDEKLTGEGCITDERLGYLLGIFERKRWDLFQYADVQVSTEIALAELRSHRTRSSKLRDELVEAARTWRSVRCSHAEHCHPMALDHGEDCAINRVESDMTALVDALAIAEKEGK